MMRYFIIAFLLLFGGSVIAQTVGQFRYDTVKIYKVGGFAELVLQNKTKDTTGFLFNLGSGITEFRRPRQLNDSTIIIGVDTFTIRSQGSANNYPTSVSLSAGTLTINRNGLSAITTPVTTTNITEGTNLYYTDARSRLALSSANPLLSYVNTTGVFTLNISSTDTTRWGAQQPIGNYITGLTGDGSASGPIGGGIANFVLANTSVVPGDYVNSNISVDSKGRITAITNGTGGGSGTDNTNLGSGYRWLLTSSQGIKTVFNSASITWDSTSNANGLTGRVAATYVGQTSITTTGTLTTSTFQGTPIADAYISSAATWNAKLTSALVNGNIFVGNGSGVATGVAMSGDGTIINTGAFTLTTVNSNVGSFTNATVTADAKGRITSISSGAASVIDPVPTDGSSNAVQSNGVFDALVLKANLLSPNFAGIPTAPTAIAGTNTLQIATTQFVITAANLDTIRNSTSVTILGSGIADAVIRLVDRGSGFAGLMSALDKGRLDSLYQGFFVDSVVLGPGLDRAVTYDGLDSMFLIGMPSILPLNHWYGTNSFGVLGLNSFGPGGGPGTQSLQQTVDNGNFTSLPIIFTTLTGSGRSLSVGNFNSLDNIAGLELRPNYTSGFVNAAATLSLIPANNGSLTYSIMSGIDLYNKDRNVDSVNTEYFTIRATGTNYILGAYATGTSDRKPLIIDAEQTTIYNALITPDLTLQSLDTTLYKLSVTNAAGNWSRMNWPTFGGGGTQTLQQTTDNGNTTNDPIILQPTTLGTNRSISIHNGSTSDNYGELWFNTPGTNTSASFILTPNGTGFSATNKTQIGLFNTPTGTGDYEVFRIKAAGTDGYLLNSLAFGAGVLRAIHLQMQDVTKFTLQADGNIKIASLDDATGIAKTVTTLNGVLGIGDVPGGSPALTTTRVGIGVANVLGEDADFTYDVTNNRLFIGTGISTGNLGINATQPTIRLFQSATEKAVFGVSDAANALIAGSAVGDVIFRATTGKRFMFSDDATRHLDFSFVPSAHATAGDAPLFQTNTNTTQIGHGSTAFIFQNLDDSNSSRIGWFNHAGAFMGEIGPNNLDGNFGLLVSPPSNYFILGWHPEDGIDAALYRILPNGKTYFAHWADGASDYTWPGQFDFKNTRFIFGDTLNDGNHTVQIHDAGKLALKSTQPYIYFQGSSLSHDFTGFLPANTGGYINLLSSTVGGLGIIGVSDGDQIGIVFAGAVGSTTPTVPAVAIRGYKYDGAGSLATATGTHPLLSVEAGGTVRLQVLANGRHITATGAEGTGKVWTWNAGGYADWATGSGGGGSLQDATNVGATTDDAISFTNSSDAFLSLQGVIGAHSNNFMYAQGIDAGGWIFASNSSRNEQLQLRSVDHTILFVVNDVLTQRVNTDGTFDFLFNAAVTKSQNAITGVTLSNVNAGASASAALTLTSDGGSAYIYRTSIASTPGDALVLNETGGGPIILFTAAEAVRIANNGSVSFSTSFGTSGQVLTSAGTGGPPTWTTIGGGDMLLNATNTMGASGKIVFPALTTDAVLRVGGLELQGYSSALGFMSNNMYFNGADYTYRANGTAQVIEVGSNYWQFKTFVSGTAGGTTGTFVIPFTIEHTNGVRIGVTNGYANFGGTAGTAGYGVRDNAGTMEWKNSGGAWAIFGSGGGGTTETASNGLNKVGSDIQLGGALTGVIEITGPTQEVYFGISGNKLNGFTVYSDNDIVLSADEKVYLLGGVRHKYTIATDANFTATAAMYAIELPTISANRTFTIADLNQGQIIYVLNKNSAGFAWNITGDVKDAAGNAITSFVNDTNYILMFDGTDWIKMN